MLFIWVFLPIPHDDLELMMQVMKGLLDLSVFLCLMLLFRFGHWMTNKQGRS